MGPDSVGHAESPDLVHCPSNPCPGAQSFEVGCWSGASSSTRADAGPSFTPGSRDDWGRARWPWPGGQKLRQWVTTADDVVIDGPPPGLGVHSSGTLTCSVMRAGGRWSWPPAWLTVRARRCSTGRPTCATGLRRGALLPLSSGRTKSGRAPYGSAPAVPLGGDWVLLVSVWDADELHYVAGAIGIMTGGSSAPELATSDLRPSAYAMSSFVDKEDNAA